VLRDWQRERAIPRHVKFIAVVSISLAWLLLLGAIDGWLVPAVTGVVLASVSAWIATRPVPKPATGD